MKDLFLKYFLAFIFLLLHFNCKKIEELTQFHMPYDETFVVKSNTAIGLPFNIISPEIESNSEHTFSVNDTRKDLVKEIILEKLELSVTNPPNKNFSFLKSAAIYLSANELSEIKVAWIDEVPENAQTIKMQTTDDNLKDYIIKEHFTLRLNTVTREVITSDHHIHAHALFFVNAKLL